MVGASPQRVRQRPKSRARRSNHGRQGPRIRASDADYARACILRRPARPPARTLPGGASCLCVDQRRPAPSFDALAGRLSGPEGQLVAGRIRAAYEQLRDLQYCDGITSAELDIMCFGEPLPPRSLDPRVVRSIAQIVRFGGEPVTAASCAAAARLSSSRFLHLFKQETGISFRAFRAWKRARHLLHFANQDLNLAHLAQDIGYPDSTHFSHSIRRFYGLMPRAIFSGSRDLAIYRSGRAGPGDSAWTQEAS